MALLDSCGPSSFCVPVFIRNLIGGEDFTGFALIDTGADHTLIPARLVEQLGLPIVGHRDVQTANGYTTLETAYVEIQVGDKDPVGAQMLVVDTDDLIAVGVDLVRQLGLLVAPDLN
jgi:predicted aspartyl protease